MADSGIILSAHNQWANRPADQRFWTPEAMATKAEGLAIRSKEVKVPWRALRADVDNGALVVRGQSGTAANFTYHSFGQVAAMANAPAAYLRTLPPTLAAQNLNHGLKTLSDRKPAEDLYGTGLFAREDDGAIQMRALTTESYGRLWNHEMIRKFLVPLAREGWVAPPARPTNGQTDTRIATEADCGAFTYVQPGETIAPAGLYCSEKDFFAFMVDKAHPIDVGGERPGFRFLLFSGDELGGQSIWLCLGVEDASCGNHIIHGARNVVDVRLRHVKSEGSTDKLFSRVAEKLEVLINTREDGSIERVAKAARMTVLGHTKDDVLEAVFKYARTHGLDKLGKKRLEAAYDVAQDDGRWGSPNTVWGLTSGLTYNSQKEFAGYADVRTEVDAQAGRLLSMATF